MDADKRDVIEQLVRLGATPEDNQRFGLVVEDEEVGDVKIYNSDQCCHCIAGYLVECLEEIETPVNWDDISPLKEFWEAVSFAEIVG